MDWLRSMKKAPSGIPRQPKSDVIVCGFLTSDKLREIMYFSYITIN